MGKKKRAVKTLQASSYNGTKDHMPSVSSSSSGSRKPSAQNKPSMVTYDALPHVVETIMAHSPVKVLLAFRLTCRPLRDRADAVLGYRVGMHMVDRDVVFATHGDASRDTFFESQRLPAFRFREKIYLEVFPTPQTARAVHEGRLDHRNTYFNVHESDAEWFATFLKGIRSLDIHGENRASVAQGREPGDGPDCAGRMAVRGVKVRQITFMPAEHEDAQTVYATAVPFCADQVTYYTDFHMPRELEHTCLCWPKWVPECRKVVHQIRVYPNVYFGNDLPVDKMKPITYPPTVKEVDTYLWAHHEDKDGTDKVSTFKNPVRIPASDFSMIILRFCGSVSPDIEWRFLRFNTVIVAGTYDVPPNEISRAVLDCLVLDRCLGTNGRYPTDAEGQEAMDEIQPHIQFLGQIDE